MSNEYTNVRHVFSIYSADRGERLFAAYGREEVIEIDDMPAADGAMKVLSAYKYVHSILEEHNDSRCIFYETCEAGEHGVAAMGVLLPCSDHSGRIGVIFAHIVSFKEPQISGAIFNSLAICSEIALSPPLALKLAELARHGGSPTLLITKYLNHFYEILPDSKIPWIGKVAPDASGLIRHPEFTIHSVLLWVNIGKLISERQGTPLAPNRVEGRSSSTIVLPANLSIETYQQQANAGASRRRIVEINLSEEDRELLGRILAIRGATNPTPLMKPHHTEQTLQDSLSIPVVARSQSAEKCEFPRQLQMCKFMRHKRRIVSKEMIYFSILVIIITMGSILWLVIPALREWIHRLPK